MSESIDREIHILSYFSLPTNLAEGMSGWPEFIDGSEYDVDMRSGDETIAVRFEIEEEGQNYVSVKGHGNGPLFERVLGFVTYALAAHSDDLMIDRIK